jgi:hypothetical protein
MVAVYNSALVSYGYNARYIKSGGLNLCIPFDVSSSATALRIEFVYLRFTCCTFSLYSVDGILLQEKELSANATSHELSFNIAQYADNKLLLKVNSDYLFEVGKIELLEA